MKTRARPTAKKKSSGTATKRAATKKAATKKSAATKVAASPKRFGRRADLGAPVDGFFAKQPAHLRPILDALRGLVGEIAPDASSTIKWGMPFYMVGGNTLCALASFKSHVNLILAGPPGTFADPGGLLEGDGKTGKHLKVRALEELPRDAVRKWLRVAADRARKST